MYAWYMPIPSTGRARLAVSAVVLLATLTAALALQRDVTPSAQCSTHFLEANEVGTRLQHRRARLW